MEPRVEPSAVPLTARAWVEALAKHVRQRFNGRAVVTARTGMGASLVLSQVQALEEGGVVLSGPCDHPQHVEGGHAGDHNHDHGEHAHDEHGHERGAGDHDHVTCRGTEWWIASPDQVLLEVREAHEGALCTGFAFLGLSRTPHVLVPRGTEPLPKRGHDHGEF